MARRINAAGLRLIKSFEGFEPKWYRDPVGIWTIGFGHTDAAGAPKHATSKGLVLSDEAATEILANDLGQYAAAVEKAVKVPLNDNQFAALVSFTYNVGAGALAKSTLVKKLNAGNYGAVRSELAKWNKAGGKVLKGLTRRRAAEASLFETKPSPVLPLL
jgi:lysozyme